MQTSFKKRISLSPNFWPTIVHRQKGFGAFRAEQWLPLFSCCSTWSYIVGGPGAGNWVGISLYSIGGVWVCTHVLTLFAFTQAYPTLSVIKSYTYINLYHFSFTEAANTEWSGSELGSKRWHQSRFQQIKISRWWTSLLVLFHSHRALVSELLVHIRQAMRAQCLIYSSVTRATHKRGEFEHRAACSCHLHPVWFIVALMIFSPWENAEPSLLVLISESGLDKIIFFASFIHDVCDTNEALWDQLSTWLLFLIVDYRLKELFDQK